MNSEFPNPIHIHELCGGVQCYCLETKLFCLNKYCLLNIIIVVDGFVISDTSIAIPYNPFIIYTYSYCTFCFMVPWGKWAQGFIKLLYCCNFFDEFVKALLFWVFFFFNDIWLDSSVAWIICKIISITSRVLSFLKTLDWTSDEFIERKN